MLVDGYLQTCCVCFAGAVFVFKYLGHLQGYVCSMPARSLEKCSWHVRAVHVINFCYKAVPDKGLIEVTWDFPKIKCALFWGPYIKDPTT